MESRQRQSSSSTSRRHPRGGGKIAKPPPSSSQHASREVRREREAMSVSNSIISAAAAVEEEERDANNDSDNRGRGRGGQNHKSHHDSAAAAAASRRKAHYQKALTTRRRQQLTSAASASSAAESSVATKNMQQLLGHQKQRQSSLLRRKQQQQQLKQRVEEEVTKCQYKEEVRTAITKLELQGHTAATIAAIATATAAVKTSIASNNNTAAAERQQQQGNASAYKDLTQDVIAAVTSNYYQHRDNHHQQRQMYSTGKNDSHASKNKKILQVDEVIAAVRKNYGQLHRLQPQQQLQQNHLIDGDGVTVTDKVVERQIRDMITEDKNKTKNGDGCAAFPNISDSHDYEEEDDEQLIIGDINNDNEGEDDDDINDSTMTTSISNIITVSITDDEDNINTLPQTLFSTSTIRTEDELKTQRRYGIKVHTTYNYCYNNDINYEEEEEDEEEDDEEEEEENVECSLECATLVPDHLYRYQFSNRFVALEKSGTNFKENFAVAANEKKEEKEEEIKIEVNALGNNGWHRILQLLQPPVMENNVVTSSSSLSLFDKLIQNLQTFSFDDGSKSHKDCNNSSCNATLYQLTAINILENPHHPQYSPILTEEDAIRDEYETLQREIKSLEKDRLALEIQFYEIEALRMKRQPLKRGGDDDNDEERKSYRRFRHKLRCMKSVDILSLPSMLWMEDVPIEDPPQCHPNRNRFNDKRKNKTYRNDSNCIVNTTSKTDDEFQKSVREHRGAGLALLIVDSDCRNDLIGHCYTRFYMNKQKEEKEVSDDLLEKPTLRVEGEATMIYGGGQFLRYCGIIGQTSSSNTSYFLKFDGGKSYCHGSLPSNLMARLLRENRKLKSVRYLSTGPLLHCSSYSDEGENGGARCFYLEFDSGECWWTTSDDELQCIFYEVDIHRVAFGSSTDNIGASASWIVIAKDGSVFYKNIPQGLHDALTLRAEESPVDANNIHCAKSPCEVSLGMSGSYFIRFLDGTVDYNLPKFAADVFEKIESQGLLRNVCLHVDTADCLIRFQ